MNLNPQPVRVPINFFSRNEDISKATSGQNPSSTDYSQTEDVPEAPRTYFNASIPDREEGWVVFRRNPDGQLDYNYARDKVVDVIHIAKLNVVPLTPTQQTILGCCFPTVFNYVDMGMIGPTLRTSLKISILEAQEIAMRVADHLCKEEEYEHSVRRGR